MADWQISKPEKGSSSEVKRTTRYLASEARHGFQSIGQISLSQLLCIGPLGEGIAVFSSQTILSHDNFIASLKIVLNQFFTEYT